MVRIHQRDHGEEDTRSENGSGKKAISQASGRQGPHCGAPGGPPHHEDLRHPRDIANAGEKHQRSWVNASARPENEVVGYRRRVSKAGRVR